MQSLKPHTALLVVCLLGQKLGDNVVSLSQLNAVSTLFLMGKFFIKPFFTKTQGCFLQYPCYLRSGAKSEASLALLACVLRPPLGRCLTQQSTSFFFFENVEVGVRVQSGCFFSLWTPSLCLEKLAGNRFLLNIWLRSGQERQDPREPLSWYTRHWPEVLVTVL